MSLIKWNPKRNIDPFSDFFDFEQPFAGLTLFPSLEKRSAMKGGWYPAIDVTDEKDKIIVKADLPGLKKEEINVSVDGNFLSIKGERKVEEEEKKKNYYRLERSYGAFERQIDLGSYVDAKQVKAKYNDGVLEVELKKTTSTKENQIMIE